MHSHIDYIDTEMDKRECGIYENCHTFVLFENAQGCHAGTYLNLDLAPKPMRTIVAYFLWFAGLLLDYI